MKLTGGERKKNRTQVAIVLGVVIIKGRVLLTQRYEPECPDAHLKWELPGGKIEFGEEPAIAVKREIFEETGVKIEVEKLIPIVRTCIWEYTDGTEQHTVLIGFKCKFTGQYKSFKKDHHIKRFKWVKLEDVKKLKTLPGDSDFIFEPKN